MEDAAEDGFTRSTREMWQFPQLGELLLGFTGEILPVRLLEIGEGVAGEVRDVGGENAPETEDDGKVVGVEGFDGGPVQVQGEVGGGERDVRGGWGAMGGKTSG